MQIAVNIAQAWKLTDRQFATLLGYASASSARRWRRLAVERKAPARPLTDDQLLRVAYLLGIYKALHILFSNALQADTWIHRPNEGPGFEGKPAREKMLMPGTEGLKYVRQYLEGWTV